MEDVTASRRRWTRVGVQWLGLVAGIMLGMFVLAPPALAHGEAAQEAFLRTQTATFFDVVFSEDALAVGEPVVVSGKVKLLDAWPSTLPEPEVAYLTVNVPGPTFVLHDRRIGDRFVPQSIVVEKGATYDFSMTLMARRIGRWHVHPALAVEGSGTLVGPGRWIEIGPGEDFSNLVTLADGRSVDLETYGTADVISWHFVTFAIGGLWLLWWLVPRPLLQRTVWVREGAEDRLITPLDRKAAVVVAIAAVLALLAGNVVSRIRHPSTIPQQTYRLTPAAADVTPAPVVVEVQSATYDGRTNEFVMEARFENRSSSRAHLAGFTTSTVTFASEGGQRALVVSPTRTIEPGEEAILTLEMRDEVWDEEHLIDPRQAQIALAGLLFFDDDRNRRSFVEVRAFVVPRFTG